MDNFGNNKYIIFQRTNEGLHQSLIGFSEYNDNFNDDPNSILHLNDKVIQAAIALAENENDIKFDEELCNKIFESFMKKENVKSAKVFDKNKQFTSEWKENVLNNFESLQAFQTDTQILSQIETPKETPNHVIKMMRLFTRVKLQGESADKDLTITTSANNDNYVFETEFVNLKSIEIDADSEEELQYSISQLNDKAEEFGIVFERVEISESDKIINYQSFIPFGSDYEDLHNIFDLLIHVSTTAQQILQLFNQCTLTNTTIDDIKKARIKCIDDLTKSESLSDSLPFGRLIDKIDTINTDQLIKIQKGIKILFEYTTDFMSDLSSQQIIETINELINVTNDDCSLIMDEENIDENCFQINISKIIGFKQLQSLHIHLAKDLLSKFDSYSKNIATIITSNETMSEIKRVIKSDTLTKVFMSACRMEWIFYHCFILNFINILTGYRYCETASNDTKIYFSNLYTKYVKDIPELWNKIVDIEAADTIATATFIPVTTQQIPQNFQPNHKLLDFIKSDINGFVSGIPNVYKSKIQEVKKSQSEKKIKKIPPILAMVPLNENEGIKCVIPDKQSIYIDLKTDYCITYDFHQRGELNWLVTYTPHCYGIKLNGLVQCQLELQNGGKQSYEMIYETENGKRSLVADIHDDDGKNNIAKEFTQAVIDGDLNENGILFKYLNIKVIEARLNEMTCPEGEIDLPNTRNVGIKWYDDKNCAVELPFISNVDENIELHGIHATTSEFTYKYSSTIAHILNEVKCLTTITNDIAIPFNIDALSEQNMKNYNWNDTRFKLDSTPNTCNLWSMIFCGAKQMYLNGVQSKNKKVNELSKDEMQTILQELSVLLFDKKYDLEKIKEIFHKYQNKLKIMIKLLDFFARYLIVQVIDNFEKMYNQDFDEFSLNDIETEYSNPEFVLYIHQLMILLKSYIFTDLVIPIMSMFTSDISEFVKIRKVANNIPKLNVDFDKPLYDAAIDHINDILNKDKNENKNTDSEDENKNIDIKVGNIIENENTDSKDENKNSSSKHENKNTDSKDENTDSKDKNVIEIDDVDKQENKNIDMNSTLPNIIENDDINKQENTKGNNNSNEIQDSDKNKQENTQAQHIQDTQKNNNQNKRTFTADDDITKIMHPPEAKRRKV